MRKDYKAQVAPVILLMILCLACTLLVLGQGGTGRETPNANATKPSASKRKRPARKPTVTSRSTAPANNRDEEIVDKTLDKPKLDDPAASERAATERTYWETIRLSIDPKDFKSYLAKYPNGQFAGLARYNLKRLETAAKPGLKTDSAGRIILGSISGSSDEGPKPGSLVGNQIGMELVYVPPGSFLMGSDNGQADEKPVHLVTIKYGFYMGRYEVTQAEWQEVMGGNPSHFKGDRLPVDQVSWLDAQSFISKLNDLRDGFRYRLPTEAEWEYACRAGTRTEFAFGNSVSSDQANFDDRPHSRSARGVDHLRTTVVGSFAPNAFGLYDMHGNLWEWCEDWSHETYSGAPTDGSAWLSGGKQKDRVLRGGAWGNPATVLRSADRIGTVQDYHSRFYGFRVVAVARTQ